MSVTGRLDFSDLDSPQAMPPAARAERAHRRALADVHGELRTAQPGFVTPQRPHRTSSDRARSPDVDSSVSPSTHSTRMSDEDMIVVLKARLDDAMALIEIQQRMIRKEKAAIAAEEARRRQMDDVRQLAEEAEEVKQQDAVDESLESDDKQYAALSKPADSTERQGSADSVVGTKATGPPPPPPPPPPPVPTNLAPPLIVGKPPKLKDIHCRRFNGKEVYPGLGAGFEDFLNEFECAVRMEQLLNGSTWSNELKASVLGTFLEDAASRAYFDFTGNGVVTYDVITAHQKKEFGCSLTQYELGKRLDTHKRAGDTWKQYVTYLKFIERLMVGDRSQLLLETVCNNACPELTSTLLSKVNESSTNYMQELDKVVEFLIRCKGDGRRVSGTQQQQRGQPNSKSNGQQQGGNKQEQKPRQQQQHNKKNTPAAQANSTEKTFTFKCWNCGETGHRREDCTKPKKNAKKDEKSGEANQAQHSASVDSQDDSEEAELWVAAEQEAGTAAKCTSWLIDSGATDHMCCDETILFGTSPSNLVIKVANGGVLRAQHKGSCVLRIFDGDKTQHVVMHEVHYVPGLARNLISVMMLTENGITTTFDPSGCYLRGKHGKVVAVADRQGKTCLLKGEVVNPDTGGAAMFVQVTKATLQHWHERLGHVNFQDLLRMYSKGLTGDMEVLSKKLKFCLPCAEAKQTKSKHPTTDTSSSAPTDQVGAVLGVDLKTDIPADRNGNKHMLSIVDYGSSFNRVYLLGTKAEAADKLMNFIPEFERQHSVVVKVIRSDGGGEFQGREFVAFCKRHGIKQQLTLPGNSASNGKVERLHRTLMDSGRAMLWASGLPERYWGDAVQYASYIRNRLPTRANADSKSPMEILTGKPPNVGHILKFGSTCTTHIAHKKAASVKRRAEKGVVIGISEEQKGYRLFIPRTRKVVVSADVQNIDKLDVNEAETKKTLDQLSGDNEQSAVPTDKHQDDEQPTVSTDDVRTTTPVGESQKETASQPSQVSKANEDPPRGGFKRRRSPRLALLKDADVSSDSGEDEYAGSPISAATLRRVFGSRKKVKTDEFSLTKNMIEEVAGQPATLLLSSAMAAMVTPRNIAEAKQQPEWPEWKAAIEKELQDLQANGTWEVVRRPVGENMISSKWVFRIKFNSRGELERFKARLVARGFSQRFGIDFEETYSPVLKLTSLRFLAALAAQWRRRLRQGDVPNAYVKANLDRPILMTPPEGTPDSSEIAWLLVKSLYGLKQSGLLWNKEINKFLLELGFKRSKLDPCLYSCRRNGNLVVLGLYVDDVIIVGEDDADSDWVMHQLAQKFDIKDMGDATKCLGICIERNDSGIFLHQRDTIEEVLVNFEMDMSKPVHTPMETSRAFDDDVALEQSSLMRKAIGSLLWISNCTRPDITAAVNYLARFVAFPRESHWRGVKRILRYLRGTSSFGLFFKTGQGTGCKWSATIYSDADWAGDATDAKSVSGCVLMINGIVIAWASKKQTSVALSTMEAEYIAAAMAVKDAVWIKQLLVEIGLWKKDRAITLQVDNQSAIKSMENEITSSRSKHINVRYHFIRDVIKRGDVKVNYCPTQQQLADILTKPLQRVTFTRLREQLHVSQVAATLREAVGVRKAAAE